ncbi:beta-galactosidase 10-like [Impatiens glandulifera]|uniref:beta-galactosidase 10-like n=1 Tax=Impatiens glandulifera TaxID=253017 RepID=UPI001FB12652|nr:beta-galactosidase 10-like [Impatiens glandulifera]
MAKMGKPLSSVLAIIVFLYSLFFFVALSSAANVTYDRRSLIIDGQRKLLISASIHYPRSVPGMWPGLVKTAKEGGVDVIESYVFWNGHEPSPDNYYFDGRYDLVKFVKIVKDAGMYMMLRIGPFVAAEWNFGGVPVWLHYVPGTVFRTNNEPFKYHMQKFMTVVVNLMKQEKLFASQGGPIILAQVENEYGYLETLYGEKAKQYAMWAAQMALSQNIGIPWIMCNQDDAPDPVINTCNSFYCDTFTPNSPNKPKLWTENWPGWFKTFGARDPHRPPEDIAFSVARFFQKGGSLQNYYMYHGGTNFGRTSGGPFVTTSYDYDAPIDEYGLARLPKWSHLKELHKSIKLCEKTLLSSEPTIVSLGPLQEADVYADTLGNCVAFIANIDDKNDKMVEFQNVSYYLPAWSVSILPDCKHVVFNTAKVGSQTSVIQMVPESLQPSFVLSSKPLEWEVFVEKSGIWGEIDFTRVCFVDHINTTKDTTDYLWYTSSFYVDESEDILKKGGPPVLKVESKGHALHAFVNGKLEASAFGSKFKLQAPISLKHGKNEIALLSMTVGMQSGGPSYDWVGAGLTSVQISFGNGTKDLSAYDWSYKIGLEGEHLGIHNPDGSNNVKWVPTSDPPKEQPLTWYKAVVDAPPGEDPIGLDMIHMGKGFAWLNGEHIGRYWPIRSSTNEVCVQQCDYRGTFFYDKCMTGCGEPTQRWYHIPRSWFKPTGNVLIIFEEKGGDPTMIRFSRRKTSGACAMVSEDHPSFDPERSLHGIHYNKRGPAVQLTCPTNTKISEVRFASYGNPTGSCGSYTLGNCHDPNSFSTVKTACLNKDECSIELNEENFNTHLCSGTVKKLAVEAICS